MLGLCSSKEISFDKKQALIQQVIGDDKSDESEDAKLRCKASMPDPKIKEQVWAAMTDTNSKQSNA